MQCRRSKRTRPIQSSYDADRWSGVSVWCVVLRRGGFGFHYTIALMFRAAKRVARCENPREAFSAVAQPSPFWSAAALPPLFRSTRHHRVIQREALCSNGPSRRRHSEERFSRRRISSPVRRPDHHDEDGLDVVARATHHWMRFFAALRMTARRRGAGKTCERASRWMRLQRGRLRKSGGRAAALYNGLGALTAADAPRFILRGGQRASASLLKAWCHLRRCACSLSRARSPAGVVMTVSGRRIAE